MVLCQYQAEFRCLDQGAQGRGQLDLHLYCDRASGGPELVHTWRDIANSLGSIDFTLDDSILPSISSWEGPDVTWPYFFVVKEGGARLTDDDARRAPFSLLRECIQVVASSF